MIRRGMPYKLFINAIKKLNMTKEEACAFMDTTLEQYEIYKQVEKNAKNREHKK